MPLTGRFTFRKTFSGRIVLQVEEEVKPFFGRSKGVMKRRWRDANLMDLAAPEMRALIDLRQKPQFMAQSYYAPMPEKQEPQLVGQEALEQAVAGFAVASGSAAASPRRTAH